MEWNLQEAVEYYRRQGAPSDQAAVVSLLRELQQNFGGTIPAGELAAAAQALGVKETFLLAIVRRIPGLRVGSGHLLELCGGPNCGKARQLQVLAEELVAGKEITLRYVGCMRLCGKGPNLKWDGTLYHRADETLLRKLIK